MLSESSGPDKANRPFSKVSETPSAAQDRNAKSDKQKKWPPKRPFKKIW
jgi:hypothetical protein